MTTHEIISAIDEEIAKLQQARARLTAQPSDDALNTKLQIEDRLIEVEFGAAEGLTDREMRERFSSSFCASDASGFGWELHNLSTNG